MKTHKSQLFTAFWCAALALLFLVPAAARAQAAPKHSAARIATPEQRTARALEAARANPLELRAFLLRMPKGGDLHNHLAGAVYAEGWIRAGAEDNLCVDVATLTLFKTQAMTRSIPPQPVCGEGKTAAAQAFKDQNLYDSLVDAFSMRSFVPSAGVSAHDHFFDAFGKFLAVDQRHTGEWLDELAARAARQNEQYLELMDTPEFSHTASIAKELGWRDDLAQLRTDLLAHGLRDDVAVALVHFDQAEALRRGREHCGQPNETPACRVQIRFIYQVLRGFPKEQVFAQTLLGFEAASVDPRIVGVNMVMPEDGYISMSDFALQMHMLDFLHGLYPKIHITMHAGELAPGLVTYEGLCCHIRLAVEQGHAERIGHGVELMYEDRPYELLKEMAARHVMVEINLTSNDVILGINGKDHPLPIYRKYGVPVALSTDDEGVSRIDITHEYVRAVETYGFSYADLKQMVRTSLEHSFLPGASLWREQDVFTRTAAACSGNSPGVEKLPSSCANFLQSTEKAKQQWELERRFAEFEASF
ncbi:MAG: adenosine deaminase family protein [Candidatus Acidiferrales bacterium]